jgi:transcription initiation factor TFIIH subunit 1
MAAAAGSSARYAVSHLKLPGTLSITATHLQWVPSASGSAAASAALDVPLRAITGLSVSKPGAASAALLVVVAPGTPGIGGRPKAMLHFTPHANDADAAVRSRDSVKDQLSAVVAANREQDTAGPSAAAGGAAPVAAAASAPSAASPSGAAAAQPAAAAGGKKGVKPELELRYRVLMANPALAALHRDLVMSHALSDAEFWSHPTRTALLNAERAATEQRRGRNARIADPKPRTDERGEMRVEVTPQLKRDLFEQYPVVRRAWEENVPSVVSAEAGVRRPGQSVEADARHLSLCALACG